MKTETIDDTLAPPWDTTATTHPGLLVVHSVGLPRRIVLPLLRGAIEVGRDELSALGITDGRVSRRHVRVELEDDLWNVHDQESRNGTFVDGRETKAARRLSSPIVRVGHTLMMPVGDRRPYESPGLTVRGDVVMGPLLQAFHERIELIARAGANLLLRGASGAGKELAASAFHAAAGRADRSFVAVNCATIQRELAERVLFGARRGAFTGAVTDAMGLVQAADGGTLFLDEIAEIDLSVQAKLLRVLETKRVTPIGAVSPVAVDVRLCAATHKDLRAEVAAGRFREDLYFRIGRPEVRLPSLHERREEIPWLIERAISQPLAEATKLCASVELVESCMLRPWPGNVRELLAEAKTAALSAVAAHRNVIAANDLDDDAGRSIEMTGDAPAVSSRPGAPAPEPEEIEAALRAEQGNVARAAARLGVARSRVRRFIERQGIDVKALRSS